MLSTNLIKKDLSSNVYVESCVALHSLAQIVTNDLARDLTVDVMGMLKHSSPGIRKRSILVLFRMFVKYPESLQQAFPLLKDRLDDPDPGVVLAAINVIVELGIRHPKSYLFLAPTFFNLLKSCHSVWIRIKLAKLFTSFTLIEPRLIKKLIDPISDIIQNTTALSLLVECIRMVIHGGFVFSKDTFQEFSTDNLLEIVYQKLKMLLVIEDINLNLLGSEILTELLEIRPDVAPIFTENITKSLESSDLDVRSHALRLIPKMVVHENFLDLMQKLMSHILLSSEELVSVSKEESDNYKTKVACCIIDIIAKDTYEYVSGKNLGLILDFEWIIEILFELAKVSGLELGHKLSDLMIDINLRVPDIREYTVSQIVKKFTKGLVKSGE
jgi:AP-3 complex subunit delta-1